VQDNSEKREQMRAAALQDIAQLQAASIEALKHRYKELFGALPRSNHREALFRRIAWRLQVLADGDLSERARHRAAEIAQDADLRILPPRDFLAGPCSPVDRANRERFRARYDRRVPPPGTVLKREYKDQTLAVKVSGHGFEFEGRHYNSLSAIASEVTGTRWNGYAFFRLTYTPGGGHGDR
jgi:hypothetical protein